MKAKVFGKVALFCGPACRDGFKADRVRGLVYGPGGAKMTWEQASLKNGFCAYCRGPVPAPLKEDQMPGEFARQEAQEARRTVFRNKRTGKFQNCRLETTDWDDPIMEASGCSGEFANDFRKRDLADGCPACTEAIAENGSEPDVMTRWGMRR